MTSLVPFATRNVQRATFLTGALFLLTGLVGVWAAYDRPAAWMRFLLLAAGLVLSLVVAAAGRRRGEAVLGPAGLLCGLLAAALAAYFLLTFDWLNRGIDKVAILYRIGLLIQAYRPQVPVPEDIHSNIAGGGLALLLPFAVAGAVWARRLRFSPLLVIVAIILAGFVALTLVLTMARGAWLGLAAGVLVAAYLGWRMGPGLRGGRVGPGLRGGRGRDTRHRRYTDILFLLALVLLAGLLLLAVSAPVSLGGLGDGSTSSRPALWQQGLDIIADYPFTGSGLGSTMMVHATYLMMLHVGFISHMHNVFLQVAIEQGLPGLLLFLVLLALAIANLTRHARTHGPSLVFLAAVASLVGVGVHGLFDAGLYASRLAPLIFVPFGFALGLPEDRGQRAEDGGQRTENRGQRTENGGRRTGGGRLRIAVFCLVSFVLFLLLLLPSSLAAFQANLGAVAQTRAELSRYTWPDVPIQDALRRDPSVNLDPAVAYYQAALSRSPANATANRRLGQIELSRGQYDEARGHLQAAYDAAPGRQAARFLLGESHAIAGEADQAVSLWTTVSSRLWWEQDWLNQAALRNRQYWYDSIGEKDKAASIAGVLSTLALAANEP